MGLDDLLISTGVDQLIKLVRDRGRVELGEAARQMSIPPRTAEDWAHVLEEEGLIAIEYKLTKIYLAWKAPTAEYVAKKTEKLQEKTGQTKDEIERLLSKVQEGGKELSEMQDEIARSGSAASLTPREAEKLKAELADLSEKQSSAVKAASARLEKLRKKVAAFGAKSGLASKGNQGGADIAGELEMLRKFEDTLQSQMQDTEEFFGAFEAKTGEMRRKVEEGAPQAALAAVKGSLDEIASLKNELASAIAAVSEEQNDLGAKVKRLQEQFAELGEESGGTPAAARKRLAEIGKMEADAKRQKANISAQLQEALAMVRKQEAVFGGMAEKQGSADSTMEQLKNEYVDISEEVSRANEELLSKQKEVSGRVSAQMAALEASKGGSQKVSQDELQKISFLLRELKREQATLEDSVKVLLKEFDLIRMEAVAVAAPVGTMQAAAGAAVPERAAGAPAAFVEKVKLSQEEEGEFERKREELRSLIRKMWEEGKGGSHS